MLNAGSVVGYLSLKADGFIKSINQAGKETKKNLGNMKEQFSAASKAATVGGAAIMAGLGTLAHLAADSSDSMIRLKAKTGATGDTLTDLQKIVTNLYKGGDGDKNTIVDALTRTRENTLATGKDLENLTDKAINLSGAFDWDVNESTRSVAQMMKLFKVSGDAAYDILVKVKQLTGDQYDDLLDSAQEYSVHFRDLGFSAQEMGNIMVTSAKTGIMNYDKLADIMKTLKISMADGNLEKLAPSIGIDYKTMKAEVDKGGDYMKNAYLNVFKKLNEIKDEKVKFSMAASIMGGSGEDITKEFIAAMADGKDFLGDQAGASKKVVDDLSQSYATQMAQLKAQMNEMFIPMGEQIIKIFKELIPVIKPTVDLLVKFLSDPAMGKTMVILGTIAGLILGIVGPIGMLISGVSTVIGTLSALGPVIGLLMGPVGWVILAITALGALFTWLYKTNSGFKTFVDKLWASTKEMLGILWEIFGAFFKMIGEEGIGPAFNLLFAKLKEAFPGLVDFMKKYLLFAFGPLGWIIKYYSVYGKDIIAIFKDIADYVGNSMSRLWGTLTGYWTWITNLFKDIFGYFNSIPGEAGGSLSQLGTTIANFFSGLFTTISNFGAGLWRAGVDLVMKLTEGIKSVLQIPVDAIIGMFDKLTGVVVNAWASLFGGTSQETVNNQTGYNVTAPIRETVTNNYYYDILNSWNIDASKFTIDELVAKLADKFEDSKYGYTKTS